MIKSILTGIGGLIIRKKHILPVALMLLFVFPIFAHAATPGTPIVSTGDDVEQIIAKLLTIGINLLDAMLWPFLIMIGDLMNNDLIIGPGMEERLLTVWVEVRNLVNIGFVIVLLVIAFYNVLGLGSEGDLAIKTVLPKLVIGLVLVNFTFLGGKLVLDISNLATTAVFALPSVTNEKSDFDFTAQAETFRISSCLAEIKTTPESGTGTVSKAPDPTSESSPLSPGPSSPGPSTTNKKTGEYIPDGYRVYQDGEKLPFHTELFCELNETKTGTTGKLQPAIAARAFSGLNANNIGILMASNMGALNTLTLVKKDGVSDFTDLTINGIFSLIMYIVFAISFLVLAILLIFRVVVLWVAIALSPLMVLFYVVPQLKDAGGGGDIVQKVTKHIIAPLIIGLVFTIGYLMISAMADVVGGAGATFASVDISDTFNNQLLLTGVADLQKFMISIATVVIVWTGVFSAAEGTYAEGIVGGIKGFAETAGKTVTTAAKYLPIVPLRTRNSENGKEEIKGFSLAALQQTGPEMLSRFQRGEFGWQNGRGTDEQLEEILGVSPSGRVRRIASHAKNESLQANIQALKDLIESGQAGQDSASISTIMSEIIRKSTSINEARKKELLEALGKAQTGVDSKDRRQLDTILRTINKSELDMTQEQLDSLKVQVKNPTQTPPTTTPPTTTPPTTTPPATP